MHNLIISPKRKLYRRGWWWLVVVADVGGGGGINDVSIHTQTPQAHTQAQRASLIFSFF